MTVERLFILHVANGIHITTHNVIRYNYMNSYTNTKVCISTHKRVSISLVYVQKYLYQILININYYCIITLIQT